MDYYAASGGNLLATFRDNILVPTARFNNSLRFGFLTLADGTDRLSPNVSMKLPLLAA